MLLQETSDKDMRLLGKFICYEDVDQIKIAIVILFMLIGFDEEKQI